MLHNIHVIPHGDELIDLPDAGSRRLNLSLRELGKNEDAGTIVILTPHGLRLRKAASVAMTEFLGGSVRLATKSLRRRYRNARYLSEQLVKEGNDLLEPAYFISSLGENSVFPLDFGTLIPLSFFRPEEVCVIGQPRMHDLEALNKIGRTLYRCTERDDRCISVIFSCDQAHTHSPEGPYGYSEKSSEYDEMVRLYFDSGDSQELRNLSEEFLGSAKPDSYWNLMILDGLLKESGRKMKFIDYHVAKYFGMMVATST
ncbi:MAG: hypothetical protein M1148_03360 [Candidatus Thermoplasmatota archaeon]|nr:hypothetical protein [Candidatus Thermoplasmatota archaeon]MCL5438217.1 hypothetical protein [Candidatus Thermoplasmatota archaeon]